MTRENDEHMEELATTLSSLPTDTASLSPTARQERIATLDILRGWAIFGILLMDIEVLYRPAEETWSGIDQGVYQFLALFGDAKFWTLLSFLFGLGFCLQLIRTEGRGPGFIALYRRRLLALILIGAAQVVLLVWGGHFLIRYGVMGFLLLACRNLSSRTLLPAALACMLIPVAYSESLILMRERSLANPATRAEVMRAEDARRAARSALQDEGRAAAQGGYDHVLAFRAKVLYRDYVANAYESLASGLTSPPLGPVSWLNILGMFLVGLYAGRRRILHDIPRHLPLIRRVLVWGLTVGIAVNAARYLLTCAKGNCWPSPFSEPFATELLLVILRRISDLALAFAYGSAFVLLAQRRFWQKLFAPLAAAGRLALTNYLLMALLLGVLAPAFGFGVYKRLGPTLASALAVAMYTTLMLLSTLWSKHFRLGPAEWLWRSLTYGKLQPMRLRPSPAPARYDSQLHDRTRHPG